MVHRLASVNPMGLDPWLVSWLISPRSRVRVASRDVAGEILNSYPHTARLDGQCPDVPWAVHLHDRAGRLSLVAFDFDTGAGLDPAGDADRLCSLLNERGIDYVVCDSGHGGRHVWLRLVPGDSLDGRYLGRILSPFFDSLDTSAITNPRAGGVRPPGSPHRLGGHSRVIGGSLQALLEPTTRAADLLKVADLVVKRHGKDLQNTATEATPTRARAVRRVDRLPGRVRELPADIRTLLDTAPAGDASAVLWKIFMAAVRARWGFEDMWALKDAPGLEHLRSVPAGRNRRRRRPVHGPGSPRQVAYRQWKRAIGAVQAYRRQGTDAEWEERARQVSLTLMDVLDRANSMPGRWTRGGAAHRRILDALALFAAEGVTLSIEADIRRIAMTVGLSRETVRQGLHALAAEGWIALEQRGAGRVAHRWKILSTGSINQTLSQGYPPPAGSSLRTALIAGITRRISIYAHDVFTSKGLGISAGNTLANLQTGTISAPNVSSDLQLLESWGIITTTKGAYLPGNTDLDRLADILGCAGVLAARSATYILERALWAWVCAEIDWLKTRGVKPTRHQLKQARVLPLAGHYPVYPRTKTGGLDYAAAHEVITNT